MSILITLCRAEPFHTPFWAVLYCVLCWILFFAKRAYRRFSFPYSIQKFVQAPMFCKEFWKLVHHSCLSIHAWKEGRTASHVLLPAILRRCRYIFHCLIRRIFSSSLISFSAFLLQILLHFFNVVNSREHSFKVRRMDRRWRDSGEQQCCICRDSFVSRYDLDRKSTLDFSYLIAQLFSC